MCVCLCVYEYCILMDYHKLLYKYLRIICICIYLLCCVYLCLFMFGLYCWQIRCKAIEWHPDIPTQMVLASEEDRAPVMQVWACVWACVGGFRSCRCGHVCGCVCGWVQVMQVWACVWACVWVGLSHAGVCGAVWACVWVGLSHAGVCGSVYVCVSGSKSCRCVWCCVRVCEWV